MPSTSKLLDLAEVALPLLDEPGHPIARQYQHPHTVAWSETIDRGDAFVLVHPEYNHSYNAALKNALDFLHVEWNYKPVGFVSYGGVVRRRPGHDGAQAGRRRTADDPDGRGRQHPLRRAVHRRRRAVRPERAVLSMGAAGMLAELAKLEGALRPLRAAAPA